MHIVIMGCGRVGSTLALGLQRLGHEITVVDQNPDSFRRLGGGFGGDTVTGLGFDRAEQRAVEIGGGLRRLGRRLDRGRYDRGGRRRLDGLLPVHAPEERGHHGDGHGQ